MNAAKNGRGNRASSSRYGTLKPAMMIAGFLMAAAVVANGSTLYLNNFGTTAISGSTYTGSPTLAPGITSAVWTTSAAGFTSYNGSAGLALALSNSSGTPTMTLTLGLDNNYKLDLTNLSFWRQRSAAGAQNWTLSVNGTQVQTGTVPTTGATTGTLTPTTTAFGGASGLDSYTFVLGLSGASGTGTFRLDDFLLTGSLTLAGGTFTTWTGTGASSTWANGGAGQFGGNYANDLANTVTFSGTGGTVTTSGTPQAGNLAFNSSGFTIDGAGLQLGQGGVAVAAAGHTVTISAPISGSSGLAKTGDGTLVLSGVNNYTGGTTLSSGVLAVGHNSALSSGAVAVNGGVLRSDSTTGRALANNVSMGGHVTLGDATHTGALTLSGAVDLGAQNRTLTTASAVTLSGPVSNGGLTKAGSGALTLSGANSYGGGTTVNAGIVRLENNSALGTGGVALAGGSLLGASGITIANGITIGSSSSGGSPVVLQSWDFTGQSSPATMTATAIGSNLDVGGSYNTLTRGSGAAASTASNSFRTTGFQNNGISTANTDYFQWQVSSADGNLMSLASLDARFAGTATFRASPGVQAQFAYSLDGANFTLINAPFSLTADTSMPTIDLSGVSALQGISADTTVTFRYYASGQTTTGGWGFNSPSGGSNGLALTGSVGTTAGGSGTLGLDQAGVVTFSGNILVHGAATLSAPAGGTATFSGDISGDGSVTKTGVGTVVLAGSNAYAGMTQVTAGVLEITGSLGAGSAVTVGSGATLKLDGGTIGGSVTADGTVTGSGTFNGGLIVSATGTLAPGSSPGTMAINGDLTINGGILSGGLSVDIWGETVGTEYDQIIISAGSLTLADAPKITVNLNGWNAGVGQSFTIIDIDKLNISGEFHPTVAVTGAPAEWAGKSFRIDYNSVALTVIPEPGTFGVVLSVLAAVAIRRRRFSLN